MTDSTTQNVTYYPNGHIKTISNYNDVGERHGSSLSFYENGDIIAQYNYINGKLQGEQRQYYKGNKLAVIITYNNGLVFGNMSTFDCNGNLTSHRTIK